MLEGLALREHKGVVPPRFVIERVLTEMRDFAGKPVAQNPLYVHFARKVEGCHCGSHGFRTHAFR